ncbi:MAG: type II toxin-antitoxin system VapB family antitoxin [Bacteroidota bacterium]|jgi:hypothetical protein
MATNTKRVTVYLEPETHTMLKLAAVESARSVSDLVNNAVQMLFKQEKGLTIPERTRAAEPGGHFATPPQLLDIDDELVREAMHAGGHRTRKEAITHALVSYITRLQQMKILALLGKIDIDPTYDYKAQRKRK